MAKDGYTLDRARDERELMDEIWFEALGEQYRSGSMRAGPSARQQIIEQYLAKTPEMRRYVESHIENGTCADAAREIRADRARRTPKPTRARPQRKGRTFISEMNALSAAPANPAAEKRPRGPKPVLKERVKQNMRAALDSGYPLFDPSVTEDVLQKKFDAKRTTCRDARAELAAELTPTKNSDRGELKLRQTPTRNK